MDTLFIIGLPRSGTSLVHNLVKEQAGRLAPTFKQFGVDLSVLPSRVRELNKTLKDEHSLAEDNDFPRYPDLKAYRKWLERRGDRWVLKSPDHISHLPILLDVFPEAKFLWCIREAGETLASVYEYFAVTGLSWPYDPAHAMVQALYVAKTSPEKFGWISPRSLDEWDADERTPVDSWLAADINHYQETLKGVVRNVSSRDFAKLY